MLVQFESKVGGFTMFGDVAVQLLRLMGHSGTVPSAILAADIPAATERLRVALRTHQEPPPQPEASAADAQGEQGEPRVPLRTRAVPLLDLLERSARAGSDLMWR